MALVRTRTRPLRAIDANQRGLPKTMRLRNENAVQPSTMLSRLVSFVCVPGSIVLDYGLIFFCSAFGLYNFFFFF